MRRVPDPDFAEEDLFATLCGSAYWSRVQSPIGPIPLMPQHPALPSCLIAQLVSEPESNAANPRDRDAAFPRVWTTSYFTARVMAANAPTLNHKR